MDGSTIAPIAFIGGGNMASALIGGLRRAGRAAGDIVVVEPSPAQRERLAREFGIQAQPSADARLAAAVMVVWAVKPQSFADAAPPCASHVARALQVSVMAGVRSENIAGALQLDARAARIVRAMPNTPALIGRGIAGLHAGPTVSDSERRAVEALFAPTGSALWVSGEADLDAVTALSGSGPAYVFYFIEAMVQAGTEMGLAAGQSRRLAQETFAGAAALAMQSDETPAQLRERVTSKGGTTHAAITSLEGDGVKAAFVRALHAARRRAEELGR